MRDAGFRLGCLLVVVVLGLTACAGRPPDENAPPQPSPASVAAPPLSQEPDTALVRAVLDGTGYVSGYAAQRVLNFEVGELLSQERFESLDEMFREFQAHPRSFGSGRRGPGLLYESLESVADWSHNHTSSAAAYLCRRWVRARPASAPARLALDCIRISWARGMDLNSGLGAPSGPGEAEFRALLIAARGDLDAWEKAGTRDPEVYAQLASLEFFQTRDDPDNLVRYQSASGRLDPRYWRTLTHVTAYASPLQRGYGKWDLALRAAEEQARLEGDADAGYARFFIALQWLFRSNPFEQSPFDYPRVRRGIQNLLTQEPDSLWLWNWQAFLASQKRDWNAARVAFDRVGPNWDPHVWRQDRSLFLESRSEAYARARGAERGKLLEQVVIPAGVEVKFFPVPLDRGEPLTRQVQSLMEAGRFPELEALHREYLARLPGSVDPLTAFHRGLSAPQHQDKAGFEALLGRQDSWVRDHPDTVAGRIAQAHTLVLYAWQARGGSWASDVTSEGWKLFGERLDRAKKVLDGLGPEARRDPQYFQVRLILQGARNGSTEDRMDTLRQGLAVVPHDVGLMTTAANYMLPRWHGSPEELGAFIRQQGKGRPEIVGRLVEGLWSATRDGLLQETGLTWREVQEGLEAWARSSPRDADLARCTQLYLSVPAGDRASGARAARAIKQFQPQIFPLKAQFEAFQAWTRGGPTPLFRPQVTVAEAGLFTVSDAQDFKLVSSTDVVPARPGTLFGVRVRLARRPPGVPLTVTTTVEHPTWTTPGGQQESKMEWTWWVYPDEPIPTDTLWSFAPDCAYEIVPGTWSFSWQVDPEEPLTRSFEVKP